MQPDPHASDGRHSASDPDRLELAAAQMPAIPERRIDVWDHKPWMAESYEPDARFDGVRVNWTELSGRVRATHVGQESGYLASVTSDVATADAAQEVGERFLRGATRG